MKNGNRLMLCDARGPLTQIIDVLAGKNGKLWANGIKTYLRQGAIKAFGWQTYGPFNLRPFESIEVLMAAINYKLKQRTVFQGKEYEIEILARQLIYPIEEEKDVQFVNLAVGALGFDKETSLSEIQDCLPDLGLELCRMSDAPRIFSSNDWHLKTMRDLQPGIFVSDPFFQKLRGQDDPQRPFLFELNFGISGGWISLNEHWREERDGDGKYFLDMPFSPNQRIVLRIKR